MRQQTGQLWNAFICSILHCVSGELSNSTSDGKRAFSQLHQIFCRNCDELVTLSSLVVFACRMCLQCCELYVGRPAPCAVTTAIHSVAICVTDFVHSCTTERYMWCLSLSPATLNLLGNNYFWSWWMSPTQFLNNLLASTTSWTSTLVPVCQWVTLLTSNETSLAYCCCFAPKHNRI